MTFVCHRAGYLALPSLAGLIASKRNRYVRVLSLIHVTQLPSFPILLSPTGPRTPFDAAQLAQLCDLTPLAI